jgi:hypothetical protein
VCFGFGGGEDSDDCSADKDCPLSIWNGNPTCVNGKCASSFCSPYCDAAGACPSGFTPLVEQIGCFCIPIEIGSSKAGEACPSGNTNPTADYCLEGLICLALTANEGSDPCTKDEDCPGSIYVGTPSCAKGKCTSSFCSAKCDEKGGCPLGFSPTLVGTEKACYCSPKFVGKGEAGAPCPAGKVNAGAEGCKAELDCVGSFSSEEAPDKCTTAADCPAEYKGAVDCVDGECASTFCAEACDADGKCPAGFEPWGDEKCFCAPVTCKKEDHKGCVEDKVHWFDSCGAQGEMVEDCTAGGKTCKDGACIG